MSEATLQAEQPPTPETNRKKILIWVGSITAVVLLLIIAAIISVNQYQQHQAEEAAAELEAFRSNQFNRAAVNCDTDKENFEILDNGDAIRFDSATKYYGATADQVFCTLRKLGAPETIETKIGQTRALDGTRTDDWAEFEATWTYHPDNGLDILIERVGEPVMPTNN